MKHAPRTIRPPALISFASVTLAVALHAFIWTWRTTSLSGEACLSLVLLLLGASVLWPRYLPKVVLAYLALAIGALWGFLRPIPQPWPEGKVSVVGIVSEVEPDQGLRLQDAFLEGQRRAFKHDLFVEASPFEDLPSVGAKIQVEVELRQTRLPKNPRLTPPAEARVYAVAIHAPEVIGRADWLSQLALSVRERIRFPSETATTLQRALLLGDRSALTLEERLAYQDTGTAHLLAISGMNLALLGLGLYWVLRSVFVLLPGLNRLRQGRGILGISAIVSLLFIALYGKLIAPSDATDRAILAFGFLMSGVLLVRRISGVWVLGWGIVSLCALDPGVWLRAGFQLSVAATSSLLLLVAPMGRLSKWLKRHISNSWLRGASLWLAALVATNLVTFAATAPLGLAWFGQLPWHGLWVNLVAVPWMSLGTFPIGLIWALLALISPTLAEPLAPLVVWLSETFHAFILDSARLTSAATAPAWPLALGMVGSAGALMLLAKRTWRLGLGVVLVAMVLANLRAPLPPGLTLVSIDVGHGDALLVRLPTGKHLLVDTGGSFDPQANEHLATRTLLPALQALGVHHLGALILTHADADHVGAAAALLKRLPTDELWLPPCASQKPLVQQALVQAKQQGALIREVAQTPRQSWEAIDIEVLWPPPDIALETRCSLSHNNASLVMRLGYQGRTLLLTGDIEASSEASLLAQSPQALRADILKSPHHGSKSSSTPAFLDAVKPQHVLVSGLLGRAPMPPHEGVLTRYRERAISVWVTSLHGALLAQVSPEGTLTVGSFEPESEGLRPP